MLTYLFLHRQQPAEVESWFVTSSVAPAAIPHPDPSLLGSLLQPRLAGCSWGKRRNWGRSCFLAFFFFPPKAHIHHSPGSAHPAIAPPLYWQRGSTKTPHLEWKVTPAPSGDMPRAFPQRRLALGGFAIFLPSPPSSQSKFHTQPFHSQSQGLTSHAPREPVLNWCIDMCI